MTSTSTANLAAWQLEPKGGITVKETDVPVPGPGEIRIKVSVYHSPLLPQNASQGL